MRWRIFAHPNAISKNIHSIAVARLGVFTQPRPIAALRSAELLLCEMSIEAYFAVRKFLL